MVKDEISKTCFHKDRKQKEQEIAGRSKFVSLLVNTFKNYVRSECEYFELQFKGFASSEEIDSAVSKGVDVIVYEHKQKLRPADVQKVLAEAKRAVNITNRKIKNEYSGFWIFHGKYHHCSLKLTAKQSNPTVANFVITLQN